MVDDLRLSSDSDDERSEDRDDEKLLKSEIKSDFYPNDRSNRPRKLFLVLVAGFFINVVWTSALVWKWISLQSSVCIKESLLPGPLVMIYSPAREAVKYEIVETNTTIDSSNVYMGKPRPEQTLAWEEITKWRNIAVSKDDLEKIGQDSIELADGTGYMATLEVFHHIHCLDFIRMYIFKDYYDTHENENLRWKHVDHCIEILRTSAMCQADISLVTWQWVDRQELPFANFDVKHECRNWDSILEWTKNHQAAASAIVRPPEKTWPPHPQGKQLDE
ncbi:conserved hypothetical protein [Talaromyces stipitatus ATCC 10500]|uniref:Tat pathway signal sequence n=1 Tax=Talaromyces stipitatus (strain ATCC 10500 / CBS 375.48 / QM 6759 / NRRL 1006) TaxID=441959 RepID=B8MI66_TALSN|nr:uncharacterized protein TSTA_022820 [Talaromyces stipitatus ATCC 10500]EED17228.1 conserved hypothetical protein [Talaromyces stipitatus ATCC 10500]